MLEDLVGKIWKKMPRIARQKIVRLTQSKFTVSAAALVTNEKREILLLDHVLRIGSGWGFPGGFVNRGEQIEQALKREILEETCLELENVKLLRVQTINRHIEMIFSASTKGKVKINSREIKSYGWFTVESLPKNMSETHKTFIKNFSG